MILYTSVTKQAPDLRRAMILYAGISAFCLIIFIIYDQCFHNKDDITKKNYLKSKDVTVLMQ